MLTTKQRSKFCITGPLWREIYQWLVDSPHTEPVIRKVFPCNGTIMIYILHFRNQKTVLWCRSCHLGFTFLFSDLVCPCIVLVKLPYYVLHASCNCFAIMHLLSASPLVGYDVSRCRHNKDSCEFSCHLVIYMFSITNINESVILQAAKQPALILFRFLKIIRYCCLKFLTHHETFLSRFLIHDFNWKAHGSLVR